MPGSVTSQNLIDVHLRIGFDVKIYVARRVDASCGVYSCGCFMCYVYQIEHDWFTTADLAGANSNDPEGCTVGRADFFIRSVPCQ